MGIFTKIEEARAAYLQALWDIFYDKLINEVWKHAPEGKEQEEVDLFSDYFKGHEHPPEGWADAATAWLTMSDEEIFDDIVLQAEDASECWYESWKAGYLEALNGG